ncbi:hypothetical protein Csp2054_10735 [Curtobacterium sp. 'Ferrero']|uniref:DUF6177 family protein n=1 Tax=Curtobacterium sp. 'Ferrero' TaxID=2033654 RepID=UPI000BD0CA99|nr:DUF6177 family protein [Curtobacterium sp. 'Ferrero']PCN47591.1 hypothetical protein Csp2054_10735 [Curtobacterium sp. 'Ferrero']
MDDVTLTHPLVDAVGPGFLVSETDAAVVELSAARTGLVLDTRAADRAFVLLTPSTSRITTAMLAMLRRTGSAWIVREGDRYRAAGSTTIADDVASAMLSEQATPRSTRLGPDEVPWTEVVASVHHPATEQAGIGRTAELLLDGLATTAPAGWGTVEPATVGWSVSAVTDLARRRAPRLTRLVATAPVEGGVAAMQIRVERSATGVTEETRLALPMPGGAARPIETGPAPAGGRVVISNWLHMEPKPKPRTFTITATFDQAIGRRFSDGIFTDEKQLWMQLLWDKNSPGGFVIRTAYPTRLGG